MVECSLSMREVTGSIPVFSNYFFICLITGLSGYWLALIACVELLLQNSQSAFHFDIKTLCQRDLLLSKPTVITPQKLYNCYSNADYSKQHTTVNLTCIKQVSYLLIRQIVFLFTVIRSPERLAKIAMADYISSHPGGVLGKVFN